MSDMGDPTYTNDGADNSSPPPAPQRDNDRRFTAEDIERAREQEKSKLYGRLSALDERLKAFETEKQEAARLAQEAAAQAEAERKAREEAEMSAKDLILSKEREWNEQLAKLRQENEQTRAILDMERQFAALDQYARRRIAEEQEAGTIMPELLDLIGGDSTEAIEASIAFAKDKTAAIVASVQSTLSQQGAPMQQQMVRGTSVTTPPVGPMEDQTAYQTFTAEQLRNMSMDEYRKNRDRLLSPQARSGQGLFNGR